MTFDCENGIRNYTKTYFIDTEIATVGEVKTKNVFVHLTIITEIVYNLLTTFFLNENGLEGVPRPIGA